MVANAEVGIDQGYQLLYDNKTDSGMSGGVLLNADGQLIGLHGRGEKDEQSLSGEPVMKTGVNQGVPILYYQSFASGSPIKTAVNAKSFDDYLAMATSSQMISGREQTVIRLIDQALGYKKTDVAYFLKANANSDLGNFKEANNDLDLAIRLNAGNSYLHNNLGANHERMGNLDLAMKSFGKAIELDSSNSQARFNRGNIYLNKGLNVQALADYDEAVNLSPATC